MLDYTAQDAFTATQIYGLSDLVKGGLDGPSNTPIKALLDRTQYLFNRLYRYDSALPLAASASIDASVIGKFISVTATNENVVLTLAALSAFPYGYVLPIAASCAALKNVAIQSPNMIYLNGSYMDNMIYMHDGEVLYLLRDAGTWTVIAYKGNFERVGECVSGYVQMPGTLIRQGSTGTINVADYPRLCKWIDEKLTLNQQKVSDGTWLSDPGGVPKFRGCFSTGNGTTTRRLPDDRGLFDRYLDLNRGLDTNRLYNYPGGYEDMMIQSHTHRFRYEWNGTDGSNNDGQNAYNGDTEDGGHGSGYNTGAIEATGGNSTHPKNNAKLPLIIY